MTDKENTQDCECKDESCDICNPNITVDDCECETDDCVCDL